MRRWQTSAFFVGTLVTFPITACTAPANTSEAAGEAAGQPEPDVVAQVHGEQITLDEVDERIAGTLADLRQKTYDARRDALDELLARRLVDAEATRRGLDPDELLRTEVDAKVPPPTRAEIDALYEMNKARFAGQPRERAVARLEQLLAQRAWAERRNAFVAALRAEAGVEIRLAPPRTEIAIPASAPVLGPADAPVTVVEFTDYQCPFCKQAQSTVEALLERYAGKLRLVYQDLPLDIHAQAFQASRAARCAGEQQRFWEFHRDLLMGPGDFSDADLKRRAAGLALDQAAFAECLASERHSDAIQASLDAASRVGVQATPTFFINGRRLSGAQPLEEFVTIIDEELARAAS